MSRLSSRPHLSVFWCCLVIVISLCLTGSLMPLFADETHPPVTPWQIQFQEPRGLTVSYDGVPIVRQSTLFVVKPGWAGILFDSRNQKHQVEQGGGALPSVKAVGENENFRAQYEVEVLDARQVRLRFRGEMKQDVPAALEYAAGYFNANILSNRTFRAQTPQGERIGTVPAYPASTEQMANDVAPNFQQLEFDSRLGKLGLSVRSASRVVFFDARRDAQEWAKTAPIFWCGWMAGTQPLRYGQPVELEMTISLDASAPARQNALQANPPKVTMATAQSAIDRPVQVVPQPQKITLSKGNKTVPLPTSPVTLTVPRGETRLTSALKRVLGEQFHLIGLNPRVVEHDAPWASIAFGKGETPDLKELQSASWWQNAEGYRLEARSGRVEILSPTAKGAFYGLQTLAQLLRPRSKGVDCPQISIEDWPTRAFRGAHWFPSASGVPFHKKFIANVLARYKFNTCVIQCEAARWDTDPLIAAPNSISKADLRALVRTCRDNFIEPIPLINVPGHAEWMFRNGRNLDLAEDPKTPYAYAVNNPKSMEFIHSILSEAIEIFQPKTFHLGHDEVTMRGRFPNPENPFYQPGKTAGDLTLENLNLLHSWLAKQGIKTMVWSDMFLSSAEGVDAAQAPNPAEAIRRRSLVPSDVVIADWHYGSNQTYPSLDLFQKSNLATVAATWQTPLNIRNFSRAAQGKALGTLQTTWAGYFPDENTLKTEIRQFAAFILAGDYAWSNRAELPTELPYDAASEWTRAYNAGSKEVSDRKGTLVDLTPVASVDTKNWLSLGEGWDLEKFATLNSSLKQPHRYDDVAFASPSKRIVVVGDAKARALLPANAAATVQLKIGQRVGEIALLHATLWATPSNTVVGRMLVTYTDGTQATWDVTQGRDIAAWQGEGSTTQARRGWVSPKAQNAETLLPESGFALRVARWTNPQPFRSIASLKFEPVNPESGWAIAGLTLLD